MPCYVPHGNCMVGLSPIGILASFWSGDSQGFSQHGASVHVVNGGQIRVFGLTSDGG